MRNAKKIISIVLSGILVVTLMPFPSSAVEPTPSNGSSDESVKVVNNAGNKAEEKKNEEPKDVKKSGDSLIGTKSKVVDSAIQGRISTILGMPLTPDKILTKIAEMGVDLFFKNIVDATFETNYGDYQESSAKIMNMLRGIGEHVDKIEKITDQTYMRVKQYALETPLNNFIDKLSVIKTETNDLVDLYNFAINHNDKSERDAALEQFKAENKDRLRDLASHLNSTFDSASMVIQGRGSQDVIAVYDQLMLESYNFANGVPYEQRIQFRNILVSTWIYGALIASVLDHGLTKGQFATQMNNLYVNGKKLNTLVNKTHCLELSDVEKVDSQGMRCVYSYTLGRFVRLVDGNYNCGWRRALRTSLDRVEYFEGNGDISLGTYCKSEVMSPFGITWAIHWNSEEALNAFGSKYITSSQLEELYKKLPAGTTLVDEFINHKLATDKDYKQLYDIEKYMKKGSIVGGEKFVHNGWDDIHRWYMDLAPMNGGQGSVVSKEDLVLKVYKISVERDLPGIKHLVGFTNTIKDPAMLFALQLA